MTIYSLSKIRASLMHFILGSFVSASMGLVITLILVRELSVQDYSAYAIFLGISLLIGGIASFAIEHTAQRFMPELLTRSTRDRVIKYVLIAILVKATVLAVSVLFFIIITDYLSQMFSIYMYVEELRLWLLASFFILFFRFQSIILQIFLLHKQLKWLNIILNALRLGSIYYLIEISQLDLYSVVVVDFLANVAVLMIGFVFLVSKLGTLPELFSSEDFDDEAFQSRIKAFMGFSALREFIYLFSGHAMNRLVIGKYVQAGSMGAFGFAQSLLEFVDRYLPSMFLNNMIQPVVMAKYSEHQDSSKVFEYGNLILKSNMFILIPLIVWGMLLGEEGSLYITNNKYPDALEYFSALVLLLLLRSHNYPLQLAAVALEKTKAMMWSSVILACSIVFAVIFVKLMGVMGIVLARGMGMLARDWYLYSIFRREQLDVYIDYPGITKSILLGLLVYYLIFLLDLQSSDIISIVAAGFASFLLFILGSLMLRVVSENEIDMVKRILRQS